MTTAIGRGFLSFTKKWKIFYENDECIYYGELKNKNIIRNLYRVDKILLEKIIPLYSNKKIYSIIIDNIGKHLLELNIENGIDIKNVKIISINTEEIKYQFEVSCYPKLPPHPPLFGRIKNNYVIIMDIDFNVLESYQLHFFK